MNLDEFEKYNIKLSNSDKVKIELKMYIAVLGIVLPLLGMINSFFLLKVREGFTIKLRRVSTDYLDPFELKLLGGIFIGFILVLCIIILAGIFRYLTKGPSFAILGLVAILLLEYTTYMLLPYPSDTNSILFDFKNLFNVDKFKDRFIVTLLYEDVWRIIILSLQYLILIRFTRQIVHPPYSIEAKKKFKLNRFYLVPKSEEISNEALLKSIKEKNIIDLIRRITKEDYSLFEESIVIEWIIFTSIDDIKKKCMKLTKEVNPLILYIDVYSLEERKEAYMRLGRMTYLKLGKKIKGNAIKGYFNDYIRVNKSIISALKNKSI